MINIATVDYFLEGDGVMNTNLDGKETLLDADILVINPTDFHHYWSSASGLGILTSNERYIKYGYSSNIKTTFERRSNEISTLLNNGKIVLIMMSPVTSIKTALGSGKFESISNYDFLPKGFHVSKHIKSGSGNSNALILKDKSGIYSSYFKAFKNELKYSAYSDATFLDQHTFLTNKSDKAVGFSIKAKNGAIVFLPQPDYIKENKKLYSFIVNLAKAHLKTETVTPPPVWVNKHKLSGEENYIQSIEQREAKIKELTAEIEDLKNSKNNITKFKLLLYEKGSKLENTVIDAFKLFGFDAENRTVDDIEHDVVFSSIEGRGIAEIEGKDDAAINISKLDQLNRAVDEDFDLTDLYPQGILIGNHYRLTSPENRKAPFTEKVLIVANKKSYGLLTTLEIYKAVEKIFLHPEDESFKKQCRERILNTSGEIIKLI